MLRLALLLLILAPSLFAQESDLDRALPVDSSITMGKLPNGMHYWIRPNRTPPGKVSMMLHFHSGSLNETDDQRGLAHFLEHMAFNGSTHFPPGEMVKFFESLGMQFGQHQNAFTSFDQTTYMMHLPDTRKDTLEKVLTFFSDVGQGLLLGDEELDRERGVILEEKRSRKGAPMRIMEQSLSIYFPGSRLAQRLPIGTEEVIKTAPRERFVEYYTTWYRPGNAHLIICGDVDVSTMEPLIKAAFGDWKPVENPAPSADAGVKMNNDLRAAVLTDPELTSARAGIGSMRPLNEPKTLGDYRMRLVRRVGGWIINRRLRQMAQKGEAPFQTASVSTSSFLNLLESSDIDVSGEPGKWEAMLTAVVTEVKRAREHGFTDAEMDLARRDLLSGYERAEKVAPTTPSVLLVMSLNTAVTNGTKPMSAAQRAALAKRFLPEITAQQVLAKFRADYVLDAGLVMATLPEQEGVAVPTTEALLAVVKKAATADVAKETAKAGAAKLLEKEPEPAAVTAQSEDKELGILTVTLENGARVHMRSMDFRKDGVIFSVRFVGGVLDETKDSSLLTSVGALALSSRTAATRRLSATQLSDLLTGSSIGFGANPSPEGLVFGVTGSPVDLEDGCRLLHALLTEPRLEKAAIDRWRMQVGMMIPQMQRSAQFQAGRYVLQSLSGNDVRVDPLDKERVDAVTMEAAQAWIEGILRTAPIEVSIVGDMPREKMLDLARRYIGTLPRREIARKDFKEKRKVVINKGPFIKTIEVDTITPRAEVLLGWRGPLLDNRTDRRVLLFASQILSARINTEIREKRGLTYTSQASATPGELDGLGRLLVRFTADPDKVQEAAKIARAVVEEMIEKTPPTDAEMASIKAQIQNLLDTQLKQPSFWSQTLSSLLTGGRTLDQIKSLEKDYASVTKEQIAEALKRYVTEERYFQAIGTPAKN